MERFWHQGDVAFLPITINDTLTARKNRVLVKGTHNHTVKGGRVFSLPSDLNGPLDIAIVQGPCTILHSSSPQEHAPLELPEGTYLVRRQRQLDDRDDPRLVVD